MDELLTAVDEAVVHRNRHSALALNLILPDVCEKIEYAEEHSPARYARWFEANLSSPNPMSEPIRAGSRSSVP
jgi:hypothetical protein